MTQPWQPQAVTLQAAVTPHPEEWEATERALREPVQGSRRGPGYLIYRLFQG